MDSHRLNSSVLSWLRCFESVGRNVSFTAAATELFITQSAVSQQVRKLEQHLGVGLIERSKQGLSLTVEGQQLHLATHTAFSHLSKAIEHLDVSNTSQSVELICAPSFALRWLIPRLARFYSHHPELSLRIRADFHTLEYGTRPPGKGIMALIYGTEPLEVTHREKIIDEWLVPVATEQFLVQNPQIKHPSDLEAHHLLHDDVAWRGASPYAEWQYWLKQAGIADLSLLGGQRYNLSTLAIEAALANQGVAMGRMSTILEDIQAKRLVNVFDIAITSPASYWLVRPDITSPQGDIVQRWLQTEAKTYRQRRNKLIPSPC